MIYRLIVVDDRKDREPIYREVLEGDEFELIFVSTRRELEANKDTTADGYLIDVFLDQGDWGGANAASLLRQEIGEAPRPAPVFLVSQFWNDPRLVGVLNEIGQLSKIVVQYFAWIEFETALAERVESSAETTRCAALRAKILFEIRRWYGMSAFAPAPDETIRLLLLADLQYNDPHTDRKATFAESWVSKAFRRLGERTPDLIVIAGDISYSGSPDQYVLAEERLRNDLMGGLWDRSMIDRMRDRVIVVPGNHDVNLRFAACDAYRFDFENRTLKPETASTSAAIARYPITGEWRPTCHRDYALEPFRRFAYRLTGDRVWGRSNSLCWVDRRFSHCGIRFLGLNTVPDLTTTEPSSASFNHEALRAMTRSLAGDDPEKLFTIAVSHHGVRPVGARPNEAEVANFYSEGVDFFAMHGIKLWLYGHYHKFNAASINSSPFENSPLWCVQAPTLRVVPGNTNRGFCVIDLERSGGRVVNALAVYYPLEDGRVGEPRVRRVFGRG